MPGTGTFLVQTPAPFVAGNVVSMPSLAWVVTAGVLILMEMQSCFNALTGLSCYTYSPVAAMDAASFNALTGLSCYRSLDDGCSIYWCFNALTGLSCYYAKYTALEARVTGVSMPSRAWVVTARMSNIFNFSWYFLCIPAIYRCILAYLPIFFNQLSKFLRCESPSTFLGTCLSHHSFIIFLVTNTNTLLSGLYLISTFRERIYIKGIFVSMPSRAYTSFLPSWVWSH